jgi:hypothetical protein
MSDWTICITSMPTEEALDIAARIADAEEPDCEDLLLTEGARVCDVLRCEVLHQAEVIERTTADLSTAHCEIATLRAAYAADLDGLRAEVRRADDEREAWRGLRDAAREMLAALEAPAPVWDADESEHDAHAARLEVALDGVRALVAP